MPSSLPSSGEIRGGGLARSYSRPNARTHPVAVGTISQSFRRLVYIVCIEAIEVPSRSLKFLSNLRDLREMREIRENWRELGRDPPGMHAKRAHSSSLKHPQHLSDDKE